MSGGGIQRSGIPCARIRCDGVNTELERVREEDFPRVQFWKSIVIGYSMGTPMYTNLSNDKDLDRRYRGDVVSVSLEELQPYAVGMSNDVTYSDARIHSARIVSPQFKTLYIINHPRGLKDDRTTHIV